MCFIENGKNMIKLKTILNEKFTNQHYPTFNLKGKPLKGIMLKADDPSDLKRLENILNTVLQTYKLRLSTTFVTEVRCMSEKSVNKLSTYKNSPHDMYAFYYKSRENKMIVYYKEAFEDRMEWNVEVFIHEYSHAVDNHYGITSSSKNWFDLYKYVKTNKALGLIGNRSYGLKNMSEFFAETMTNYIMKRNVGLVNTLTEVGLEDIKLNRNPKVIDLGGYTVKEILDFAMKKYFKMN
jgi:hypothetical protein